jgi:hypothetical protein
MTQDTRLPTMIGLVILAVKLYIKLTLLCLWVCWAVIALPVAGICSMTGHERAGRQWVHSTRWHIL